MTDLPIDDAVRIWQDVLRPLCRLLLAMTFGLLAAGVLESLRWTHILARLSAPLARAAHLRPAAGAAFALACVSPAAANALLSDRLAAGEMRERELTLSIIFNSLPSSFVHAPTIFFLTWPVLGAPAAAYVGLILAAAVLRTALGVLLGNRFLPAPEAAPEDGAGQPPPQRRDALKKAWRRIRRRLPSLILFTAPIYLLMHVLQAHGVFTEMEAWVARHADWLPIRPQAAGIIVLHLAAELGAALGAAAGLLGVGALPPEEVVFALLIGNILSTPMRALRHQLPSYAGFFRPVLAVRLIVVSQGLYVLSMLGMAALYHAAVLR